MLQIDFNTTDLSSLIERIKTTTDPRGVRHDFASALVVVAYAPSAGHKSLVAISE